MDELAIKQLISDIKREIQQGFSNEEIVEYLEAYTAHRSDLVQVIRVLMAEKGQI